MDAWAWREWLPMWFLATWLGRIVGIAIVLVLLVMGIGVAFFASDQAITAHVKEKSCSPFEQSTVTAKTDWFGITHKANVDFPVCRDLPETAFIRYHIRSGHTIIYAEEGGKCLWDTLAEPPPKCT